MNGLSRYCMIFSDTVLCIVVRLWFDVIVMMLYLVSAECSAWYIFRLCWFGRLKLSRIRLMGWLWTNCSALLLL